MAKRIICKVTKVVGPAKNQLFTRERCWNCALVSSEGKVADKNSENLVCKTQIIGVPADYVCSQYSSKPKDNLECRHCKWYVKRGFISGIVTGLACNNVRSLYYGRKAGAIPGKWCVGYEFDPLKEAKGIIE